MVKHWRGVIEEYRKFLSVTKKTPVITLGEGDTPLVRADRLAEKIGFHGQLYLKNEGANPTASFHLVGLPILIAVAKVLGSSMGRPKTIGSAPSA